MQTPQHATLDFVADIICPWCAIGHRHLNAALSTLATEGLVITVMWRPFLLYPNAPPEGFAQQEHLLQRFGSREAADRYHAGVTEAARAVGFDIDYERISVTPSTLNAHRVLLLAEASGRQFQLADALARTFFEEGGDIADPAALCRMTGAVGVNPAAVAEMLASDRFLADVQQSDLVSKQRGIRQVPAFCMHGRILNFAPWF